VALRCVYTDLDGTLLGRGASLFRDGEGNFTLLPARALEACHRAGVEVVIKSGRRKAQVMEDARLLGQGSYIYEVGSGLVIDGDETFLTGALQPREGASVHDLIEESGAPALLLRAYAGRLEHHSPWHLDRQVSHLFRGKVAVHDANELLAGEGLGHLRQGGGSGHDPCRHRRGLRRITRDGDTPRVTRGLHRRRIVGPRRRRHLPRAAGDR